MNQETFDSIWTADFVQRVLREYKARDTDFICLGSDTFAKLWSAETKPYIAKLALDFHKEPLEVWHPGLGGCLFYVDDTRGEREVRLNFLKHEIKRLTTK
jgi:hypothetical protein